MKEPPQRRASRLLLLDSERRVLLFRHAGSNGRGFWALPGGGLENGETFEQAAQREAVEELGLTGVPMTLAWEGAADFLYFDSIVHQQECIFLVNSGLPDLSSEVREAHHKEGILEIRWWTATELESTSEPVFPEELASRLSKI
ncbi:MAG TPA: NUDIX domain-containing protein [Candidatus Angelobacter sp.]|nr:NUDIX domain-containing protein [Candidatus Angelobacter sp.]